MYTLIPNQFEKVLIWDLCIDNLLLKIFPVRLLSIEKICCYDVPILIVFQSQKRLQYTISGFR